jgi:hypothetical protein
MCQQNNKSNNNKDISFSDNFSKKVMENIWEYHIKSEKIAWRLVFLFTATNLAILINSIFNAASREIMIYIYNAFKDYHISLKGIGFFFNNVLISNGMAVVSILNFTVLIAVAAYLFGTIWRPDQFRNFRFKRQ